MTIPIPYYGDLKLNNNVSFTLNFDMNDSKEFKSGDKIDLEEGAFFIKLESRTESVVSILK